MSKQTVEWAKAVHLHNGPDDMIALRGELSAAREMVRSLTRQLDDARERTRMMAADLADAIAERDSYRATAAEMRHQLRLANRRDTRALTDRDTPYCSYDEWLHDTGGQS